MGVEAKVDKSGAYVNIIWAKNHTRRCSSKWVKMNCHCLQCKSSTEKDGVSDEMRVENPQILDDNLQCSITDKSGTQHLTFVPLDIILSTCTCDSCIMDEVKHRRQTLQYRDSVPYIQFQKASSAGEGHFEFLKMMMDFGFCVIRDCPASDKEAIVNFTQSIGGIRSTLYGFDWILSSHASPINAGYTSLTLPLHSDLMMYETSPGVQFLLALRFDEDVLGGESIIVDGFKCAEILRNKHPEHFKTLCRIPTTFVSVDMTRDIPCYLRHSKPHFEIDYYGEIVAVNWSPGLESTLRIREEDAEKFYQAHKAFMTILRDPQHKVEFRLRQGDMMVLNNQRVMHARKTFKSLRDGDRHLLGFYTDIDDLKNSYMNMAMKLKKEVCPPKVGNRSSF